jgi:hypothetical protein
MTAIICRSAFVARELSSLAETASVRISADALQGKNPSAWLEGILAKENVSIVFYEPSFFTDPSPFRLISPGTRFIVLAGSGDEVDARHALLRGACAVVGKPLYAQDVNGVLALVSR